MTDDLHWHRRSWDKPFKIGMVGQLTATTREQHEHAIVDARCSTSSQKAKVYDLFPPTKTIADPTNHDLARNYYATRQPGEDANGIPRDLQGANPPPAYPGAAQVITDAATGNTVRYVIERMCRDIPAALNNPADARWCEMIPPKQPYAKEAQQKKGIPLPKIPYYRMTVRVDGPGNSVAFSQAMLR